ncbi:MAG: TRAM domain-containing protein, partial [Ardenticatenaceae bacterium]
MELILTTEQMTYSGAALARHEGKIIFVPFALPGERVRVRLTATKKQWAQAELLEVLEPSLN